MNPCCSFVARAACLLGLLLAAVVRGETRAQTPTYSSYSQFYNNQLQKPLPTSTYAYTNPRQYTVDQYFLHNPAISPYLNLTRTGNPAAMYNNYVRPEQQRRASMNVQNLSPLTPPPVQKSYTPYYSHYFPTYGPK